MSPPVLISYVAFAVVIIVAITFHEYAHARVALWFGDHTAYHAGRVTLNPLAHLDPIGTLGILFVGFGWGKPVPVNHKFFRHPRADLLVSAAGPGTNLLLAVITAGVMHLPFVLQAFGALGVSMGAMLLASMFVRINLVLALFNFIPLGPLDGSHVLANLLPLSQALRFQDFNRRYGYLLLLAVILSSYVLPFSVISLLLGPPIDFLHSLLMGS